MLSDVNQIGWCTASGFRRDIGRVLGRQGRQAVHAHLIHSDIWAQVVDPANDPVLIQIADVIRQVYPGTWNELEGLAEGLDLPFRDILAWNCRGDLLASVPDGCTTVQVPGDPIIIAHNEDGLPFFRGSCFIADVQPNQGLGFKAFCYPGSLPGHTFGWNDAGLVVAVNNLRLLNIQPSASRMVICREVLGTKSINDALRAIAENTNCGGFHMTLAQVGDQRLLSVEYGGGAVSICPVDHASLHANHALHLDHFGQTVTQSSDSRQNRGTDLIGRENDDCLAILRDTAGAGLPIWRDDPDDPDNENTLATSVFYVSNKGLEWKVYNNESGGLAHRG